MNKGILSIYVQESLLRKIEKFSAISKVKRNRQIEIMLETYLKEHKDELEELSKLEKNIVEKPVSTTISLSNDTIVNIKNLAKVFGRNANLQFTHMIETYMKEHQIPEEVVNGKEICN